MFCSTDWMLSQGLWLSVLCSIDRSLHSISKQNDRYVAVPSRPSGGAADQSRRQRDQVAGGGSGDARQSAQPPPHSHGGDGRPHGRTPSFILPILSPGLSLTSPAIGPVTARQETRERLGVQAAGHAQRPGAEAHQEVSVEGCEEGKLVLHQRSRDTSELCTLSCCC